MSDIVLGPPRLRRAEVRMPGDKSISHRALILAAIACGKTTIDNHNPGDDVARTQRALQSAGVRVEQSSSGLRVTGGKFLNPGVVECGNSATSMRLLMGLFAARVDAVLDGDASLRGRPMERVAQPLRAMGARILCSPAGTPPITVRGAGGRLRGIHFQMPVASAQLKSALLLAGLRAEGITRVTSLVPTRDHTERMLCEMGADLSVHGASVEISACDLRAIELLRVPGDFSAAAFFLAAAAAIPHARLLLRDVGVNPTRTAALETMRALGLDIHVGNRRVWNGEPVADISMNGAALRSSVSVEATAVPNLIDEIPALCALAAAGQGGLVVRNAPELRVKESDRIAALQDLLNAFGADVVTFPDGIAVRGGRRLSAPSSVPTRGDHRIVMAAAVLGAAANAAIKIEDSECVSTSFPDFEEVWNGTFCRY